MQETPASVLFLIAVGLCDPCFRQAENTVFEIPRMCVQNCFYQQRFFKECYFGGMKCSACDYWLRLTSHFCCHETLAFLCRIFILKFKITFSIPSWSNLQNRCKKKGEKKRTSILKAKKRFLKVLFFFLHILFFNHNTRMYIISLAFVFFTFCFVLILIWSSPEYTL